MKYSAFLTPLFFFSISLSAQEEKHYTNNFENGNFWLSLQHPGLIKNSQYDFLGNTLRFNRAKIIMENKDALIDCREELTKLQEEGKSDSIDLEIVVKSINNFYSKEKNLKIPIIDAYCYCIKEFAGKSKEELSRYRLKLLEKTGN